MIDRSNRDHDPTREASAEAAARALLAAGPALVVAAALLFVWLPGCIEPPPKIAAIPQTGLAVRVHVFGAEAEDGRSAFEAIRENNPQFNLVNSGGDGEILVGLEQSSAACVEPTAVCEFKVALRVRDPAGTVVHLGSTSVTESAASCSLLCKKVLQKIAVQSVETAAKLLKGGAPPAPPAESTMASAAGHPAGVGHPTGAGHPTAKGRKPRKKVESVLCGVGEGRKLPSEEAERRIGQVDALKRINVLDADDFECLKKAYLGRL